LKIFKFEDKITVFSARLSVLITFFQVFDGNTFFKLSESKQVGISKNACKKVFLDSKEKNKLEILENWSILKEKNKNVFKFSIAIMKLNFLVFIAFSR
jgi:hypothetical protein